MIWLPGMPDVAFRAGIVVVVLAALAASAWWCGREKHCTRCRGRRRSRGKCLCLTDCGHPDCTGDRPTIRAEWTAAELLVLRGEKELEDL